MANIFTNSIEYTIYAAVTTRGVVACRKFVYTDNFVNGCCWLDADLETLIRYKSRLASSEGN